MNWILKCYRNFQWYRVPNSSVTSNQTSYINSSWRGCKIECLTVLTDNIIILIICFEPKGVSLFRRIWIYHSIYQNPDEGILTDRIIIIYSVYCVSNPNTPLIASWSSQSVKNLTIKSSVIKSKLRRELNRKLSSSKKRK